MNCTKEEFENTVFAKYPAKWMNVEINPLRASEIVVFALDTNGECQTDYANKLRLADYIWHAGKVIKDRTGLFSPIAANTASLSTYTYNFQVVMPIDFGDIKWEFPVAGNGQTKTNKCTCGTHAVGSDSHSSWCDIKGDK
jgi:hypothetical protein